MRTDHHSIDRHSRVGENPVTVTCKKAKSLGPRLRGDDGSIIQLSRAD